jgi:hypothetical protein
VLVLSFLFWPARNVAALHAAAHQSYCRIELCYSSGEKHPKKMQHAVAVLRGGLAQKKQ